MFEHPRNTLISAYYDGELSADGSSSVEEHLNHCAICLDEYRRLARMANEVRHLPHVSAPPALALAIRERIDSEVHGMVPVLRGQITHSVNQSSFFSALSLGTLATVLMLGVAFTLFFGVFGEQTTRRISTALIPTTLPEPVLLHEPMSTPRFRDGSVSSLPFADVEQGKEGSMLTLASIDHNGSVRGLEVIYRSGDEAMLARTLEVLMASGFEPARLGDQAISVDFLYFFTTTGVHEKLLT